MKFAHQEREVTAIFAMSVKDPLTDNQKRNQTWKGHNNQM